MRVINTIARFIKTRVLGQPSYAERLKTSRAARGCRKTKRKIDMTKQELIELLLSGVAAWNEWRTDNPDESRIDLSGADLSDAYLRDADLSGAVGNMQEIKSGQFEQYSWNYTSEVLSIGCKQHPIQEWWGFSDDRIAKMAPGALKWWKKWKPELQRTIELSPATPTQTEEKTETGS